MLLQIVYVSTARIAPGEEQLAEILEVSRRNNQRVGVTGLLVCGGRRFLQALEGPGQAVLQTFDRICRDDRHYAVVALANREIEDRVFGDWAMAFHTGGTGNGAGSLRATVDMLVAELNDSRLRAEFQGFAALHAAA